MPIEWDTTEKGAAVGEKHAAMQAAIPVMDSIVNWIRPDDVRAKRGREMTESGFIRLDVPDVVPAGESLVIQLASTPPMNVVIELGHCETGSRTTRPASLPGNGQLMPVTFHDAKAGTYRVTARSTNPMASPVTDYVYVSDPISG